VPTAVEAWLFSLGRQRNGTAGWTSALIPGEHQKLGVDQQQFGGGFLEVSARGNSRTNGVDPISGNGLDTLLAASHKREGPERMAITVGAMTGRLSAAATGERQ
jgi:hypothetical protein